MVSWDTLTVLFLTFHDKFVKIALERRLTVRVNCWHLHGVVLQVVIWIDTVLVLQMLPKLLFQGKYSVTKRTPLILLVDLHVLAEIVLMLEGLMTNWTNMVDQGQMLGLNVSFHRILVLCFVCAHFVPTNVSLFFPKRQYTTPLMSKDTH